MAFAILRTAKLKSFGEIGGSLSHNYRTRETLNADSDRTYLNEHSHKTTQSVKDAINSRLPEKRRSDAVLCIEHLITASPTWSGWNDEKQEKAFFDKSLNYLMSLYGSENVIASSIHKDESTPHLVVYVVPLDTTGRLNAKKWLGGKKLLSQMQTDFANEVKSFGLERGLEGSKAEHRSIKSYYSEVNKAVTDPKVEQPLAPAPKILESSKTFGERVATAVFQELEPRFKQMQSVCTELNLVKKRELEIRKTLKDAEIYLHSIKPLTKENREKLNEILVSESEKILLKQQIESEKEKVLKDKFKNFNKKSDQEKSFLEKDLMNDFWSCENRDNQQKKYEHEYELISIWNNEQRVKNEIRKKEQEKQIEKDLQYQIEYDRYHAEEKQKALEKEELKARLEREGEQRLENYRNERERNEKLRQNTVVVKKDIENNNDFEM